MGADAQKVQCSSYKRSESRGCAVQHGDDGWRCCAVHVTLLLRGQESRYEGKP